MAPVDPEDLFWALEGAIGELDSDGRAMPSSAGGAGAPAGTAGAGAPAAVRALLEAGTRWTPSWTPSDDGERGRNGR